LLFFASYFELEFLVYSDWENPPKIIPATGDWPVSAK